MSALETLAQIVQNGTAAEATLAVGTVFSELVDVEGQLSPINDITRASQLVSVFGLSWGRRVDAVITVYEAHHTGMRQVFHPLCEVKVTDEMTEPRALTLATLKSIPVSRLHLMSRLQEIS